MSSRLDPMLATGGELPAEDSGWAYEFKWDGMRCLVHRHGSGVELRSRSGRDVSGSYPELLATAESLPVDTVVDGEIVVLDETGRPDFARLQRRMNVSQAAVTVDLMAEFPAMFFAFDLLEFDGHDLMGLGWTDRRRFLEAADLEGGAWRVPPCFLDDGEAVLEAARRLSLEGVMAKRVDSAYLSGKRSAAWRKVKLIDRDEFVVVGSTPGSGRRESTFGALLLAAWDAGRLRYVGSVGTGFDDSMLDSLTARLADLERVDDPCDIGPSRPAARWVDPALVVEIAYSEWTSGPVLRHPSFCGLRPDRRAQEVEMPNTERREWPA